jgi:membrane-associated phospholipid phosphatase
VVRTHGRVVACAAALLVAAVPATAQTAVADSVAAGALRGTVQPWGVVPPMPGAVEPPRGTVNPWRVVAPMPGAVEPPSGTVNPWRVVASLPGAVEPPRVMVEPLRAPFDAAPAEPFFTRRDAWLALGFAAGTLAMAPLDRSLAGALQDSTLQVHGTLRDVAATLRFLGFPGSAIIGSAMYATGRVAGMPRVAAIGLHGTEAVVLSFAFVWTGKGVFGRARPQLDTDDPFNFRFGRGFRGGSEYVSFPSGHTAAAFAVAAAVTAETREIWPEATPYAAPVLYTGALLVGVSRMYHNRHWASDAMAGAAIGTFSGLKVIRYHYRDTDNRIDRWLLPTAVVPTASGATLVWVLPTRH